MSDAKTPPVVKAKAAEKAPEQKKGTIRVALDMKAADVIALDQQGFKLVFPDEPGTLLELDEETVRALGFESRVAYSVAREVMLARKKDKDSGMEGLHLEVFQPSLASAKDRLEVHNKQPGMYYGWHTPAMKRESARIGAVPAGDEVETLDHVPGSGPHTIRQYGQIELVLMKYPMETHERLEREAGEKSRSRIEAQENRAVSKIEEVGAKVFKPDAESKDKKVDWRDRSEEGSG